MSRSSGCGPMCRCVEPRATAASDRRCRGECGHRDFLRASEAARPARGARTPPLSPAAPELPWRTRSRCLRGSGEVAPSAPARLVVEPAGLSRAAVSQRRQIVVRSTRARARAGTAADVRACRDGTARRSPRASGSRRSAGSSDSVPSMSRQTPPRAMPNTPWPPRSRSITSSSEVHSKTETPSLISVTWVRSCDTARAQVLDRGTDLLQRDTGIDQPLDHLEDQDVAEAVQPLGAGAGCAADLRHDQAGAGPVVQLPVGDAGRAAGDRAAEAEVGRAAGRSRRRTAGPGRPPGRAGDRPVAAGTRCCSRLPPNLGTLARRQRRTPPEFAGVIPSSALPCERYDGLGGGQRHAADTVGMPIVSTSTRVSATRGRQSQRP